MSNKVKNILQANLILVAILALALFLRTWMLNLFPIALTNDELEYIMAAKSIFNTGEGIPTTPPFGLFSWGQSASGNVLAELPSFLISPIIGPFNSSLFLSRLPYAITSTLIVLIVYLIFSKLTQKKPLALFAAFVLAVNPWGIHFGRTAFEFTFSIFFYLLAIYLVIRNNKWSILYALPFFVAGFLSYHGAKLLFFPLVALICLWKYKAYKTNRNPILILALSALLISIIYVVTLKYQPSGARTGELVFYDVTTASSAVDNEMKSAVPGFQQKVFLNKITYFTKRITDTYLHTFSTDFLFVSGENRGAYSFWIHGLFYYIDLPFIVLGIVGLYLISRKSWWLVMGILAISPITSMLSGGEEPSYVIRSGLAFPILASLSGIGIWFLVNQIQKYRFLIGSIILTVYLIFLANFLNLFFTRYPIYNSEGFFFGNKVLSRYIDFASKKNNLKQIIISTKEPRILYEKLLFYNNLYSRDNAKIINQKIALKDFSYNNIRFIDKCAEMASTGSSTLIYEDKMHCNQDTQPTSRILAPVDAGSLFVIKNDELCNSYNLSRYPRIDSIYNFDVYNLNEERFCKTWISFL